MELSTLALTGACLLITYTAISWIISVRRLQHIPGPALASWTSLWLLRRQWKGRIARDLAALTKKYGPIFRIAPNQVVISDPQEVRRIWQPRSPWYRSRWYDMFKFDQPVDTVLSIRDNAVHAAHRAKLQPGYTGKDVDNMHYIVNHRIGDFIHLIERKYLSDATEFRPMDLSQKTQFLTLDVISDLAVGRCFNCLTNDHDVFGQIDFVTGAVPLMTTMANIPSSFILLQNPLVRAMMPKDQVAGVEKMMAMAQENAAKRYGPDKIVERDMLGSFVAHGLPYTNAWLESFGQIGAGTDTTATAMRMTLYHLMVNPDSYTKLQREIDEAIRDGRVSSPVSEEQAKGLPYLQAVIKEGLRIWPPITGFMFKICDTEQVVCGKSIPPGTCVGWEAISVLRNKEVFGEDAECFRPDRWLEEKDAEKRKVMEQVQALVFGTSTRWECLGKAIALLELNKVFVEVLRRFDLSLVNPTEPFKTMDFSLSIQRDLWVRIQRRES